MEVLHRRAPDMPVRMVEGDYESDLAGVVNTRMALEAQEEGFDAVSIYCYNEPADSTGTNDLIAQNPTKRDFTCSSPIFRSKNSV